MGLFFNLIENKSTAMAYLPYGRGVTEPLTRLLRKNGINVVTRPHKTLQQEFPSPKFNLGLLLNFRPMWGIKSFAQIVPGATLVRLEVDFQRRKRNTIVM